MVRERFILKQASVCSGRGLNGVTVHARLAVHYTQLDGSRKNFAVLFHIHVVRNKRATVIFRETHLILKV